MTSLAQAFAKAIKVKDSTFRTKMHYYGVKINECRTMEQLIAAAEKAGYRLHGATRRGLLIRFPSDRANGHEDAGLEQRVKLALIELQRAEKAIFAETQKRGRLDFTPVERCVIEALACLRGES